MRRLWLIGGLLLWYCTAGATYAQDQSTVTCSDQTQFTAQATLTLPEIPAENPKQFIVTVVGLNEYDPIIATTISGDFTDCVVSVPQAAFYEATLPTIGTIPTSDFSTQTFIVEPGRNDVRTGEINNDNGEFLMIVEGSFFPETTGDDTYRLQLTEALRQSGVPLSAYVFALDDSYNPALTITPPGSTVPQSAIPLDEATLFTDFAESTGAVGLPIPAAAAGDITLTVPRNNSSGLYALALYLGTGSSIPANAGTASTQTTEDGTLILLCDGAPVSNNAIRVDIPAGEYTVTALGSGDYDPVMALLNADGSGTCYDDSETAPSISINLPAVDVVGTELSAQATTSDSTQTLIVGAREGDAGEVTLLLHGDTAAPEDDSPAEATDSAQAADSADLADAVFTINPADETEQFTVTITPGMIDAFEPVDVYMLGTNDDLNPFVALVDEAGDIITDVDDAPIRCDDAGIPIDCYGTTEILAGSSITLADDTEIAALARDTHLAIPLELREAGTPLRIRTGSLDGETAGSYVLVLHLATE